MDTSIIVAIIVALSTTIPQIIIKIIDNNKQVELRKIEMIESSKRKVLDDFIVATNNCICGASINGLSSYYSCVNKVSVYFSKANLEFFKPLNDVINYGDEKVINSALNSIIIQLKSELE